MSTTVSFATVQPPIADPGRKPSQTAATQADITFRNRPVSTPTDTTRSHVKPKFSS